MIADLHNIPIGNVKKVVPNFFDKENYVLHYEHLPLYLRLGLKLKQIHRVLECNQSQSLKLHAEFNTQDRKKAEKRGGKAGKVSVAQINEQCGLW